MQSERMWTGGLTVVTLVLAVVVCYLLSHVPEAHSTEWRHGSRDVWGPVCILVWNEKRAPIRRVPHLVHTAVLATPRDALGRLIRVHSQPVGIAIESYAGYEANNRGQRQKICRRVSLNQGHRVTWSEMRMPAPTRERAAL